MWLAPGWIARPFRSDRHWDRGEERTEGVSGILGSLAVFVRPY
ncbi:hypothetical protein FMEAI12_5210025 [Parafrankia sp. Ea1.12]|nr:hypothetical protein FMEAI12_5210025 [Parafrankia sp. Ea1.12]